MKTFKTMLDEKLEKERTQIELVLKEAEEHLQVQTDLMNSAQRKVAFIKSRLETVHIMSGVVEKVKAQLDEAKAEREAEKKAKGKRGPGRPKTIKALNPEKGSKKTPKLKPLKKKPVRRARAVKKASAARAQVGA